MDERAMEMTIEVEQREGRAVLHVAGEVDVFTAPRLRERLVEIVDGGTKDVVVDLEGVEFLDSTGLGVLVGALKRIKTEEGTLSLVCTKDKILKLFRITGLEKVFPIHETLDSALAEA